MDIFIAGPMHTRQSFEDERIYLEDHFPNANIIDPFSWGSVSEGYALGLLTDFTYLAYDATHVFLAPGWRQSPGTLAEIALVLAVNGNDGKDITFLATNGGDLPIEVFPDVTVALH